MFCRLLCLFLCFVSSGALADVTIYNFASGHADDNNAQLWKFDRYGNNIDAHNGSGILQCFSGMPNCTPGTFYIYGDGYGCGYAYVSGPSPPCGVNVYATTNFADDITLVSPPGGMYNQSSLGPPVCGPGSTGNSGCGTATPSCIYNQLNNNYLCHNPVAVWVCSSPYNGCGSPILRPLTGVGNCPAQGQGFKDHSNNAFYMYGGTTCGGGGSGASLYIVPLDANYMQATAPTTLINSDGLGYEPASIFQVGSTYFVVAGTLCSFCSGAAAAHYWTATVPTGSGANWVHQGTFYTGSSHTCTTQIAGVNELVIGGSSVYMFRGDMWQYDGANQGAASQYWDLLTFSGTTITNVNCKDAVTIPGLSLTGDIPPLPTPDQSSETGHFQVKYLLLGGTNWIQQTFSPSNPVASSLRFLAGTTNICGIYTSVSCPQTDGSLIVDLVDLGNTGNTNPSGIPPMATLTIPASSLNWTGTEQIWNTGVVLTVGHLYGIVLHGTNSIGGFLVSASVYTDPYPGGQEYLNTASGVSGGWSLLGSDFGGVAGSDMGFASFIPGAPPPPGHGGGARFFLR